ncbi:alpha/beta hydrolase [soil metagenome]
MSWSWLYLALSVVGALFTLNAYFPQRGRFLLVPSFFGSWLTIELAAHQLVLQIVASGLFGVVGVFGHWQGRIGLLCSVASWTGLVLLVAQSRRSATTMREVLTDLVGDEPGHKVPLSEVLIPFRVKRAGVRRTRNVEFRRVAGKVLRLDVYQPREPGVRRPAVVQVHGGAWVLGDKREQGIPLLNHLAANGWVGFNVNYRLSPGATFPDHLVDVKAAVAWVRDHAEEYGIDRDFICVTGGSAGGHLAALVALTAGDRRYQPGFEQADCSVRAAVPFYGVYDFTNRLGTQQPELHSWFLEPIVVKAFLAEEPERFIEASPIDRVHAAAPPMLVIHGDRDTLVPVADARHFVERLDAVSEAPVLYAELQGSQHAFDVFASIRTSAVIEGVERFLAWVHRGHLDQQAGRTTDAERDQKAETDALSGSPAVLKN